MRVESHEEETFQPKSLTLTFESDAEVQAFYFVFNFTPIHEILSEGGIETVVIREKLQQMYPKTHRGNFNGNMERFKDKMKKYL